MQNGRKLCVVCAYSPIMGMNFDVQIPVNVVIGCTFFLIFSLFIIFFFSFFLFLLTICFSILFGTAPCLCVLFSTINSPITAIYLPHQKNK